MEQGKRENKRRQNAGDVLIRAVIVMLFCLWAVFMIVLGVAISQSEAHKAEMVEQTRLEEVEAQNQEIHDTPATVSEMETVAEAQTQTPAIINDGYTQTLTKSKGVNYYNGLRETYYSSKVAKHMNIGEWWCDSNGFWRTSEGYFVVAYTMTLPIGTVINISQGSAQVLDHCPTQGAVDVYTNW